MGRSTTPTPVVTGPCWCCCAADAEGNHTQGTRIASGRMKFALAGDAPAARVKCTGELEEIRHGFPSDVTTGLLTRIQWRPAIKRTLDAVSFVIDGYAPGEELASTEDRRRDGADSWAFLLTLRIEALTTNGRVHRSATSPISATSPGRAQVASAFQLALRCAADECVSIVRRLRIYMQRQMEPADGAGES